MKTNPRIDISTNKFNSGEKWVYNLFDDEEVGLIYALDIAW